MGQPVYYVLEQANVIPQTNVISRPAAPVGLVREKGKADERSGEKADEKSKR